MDAVNQYLAHTSLREKPQAITREYVLYEAQRCLYCDDAPCVEACPVSVDVPGFLKQLALENWKEASRIVYESNPMASICGLSCPAENLCQGACVFEQENQPPIEISALQYYATMQEEVEEAVPDESKTRRVAVIGGGPSGIGCAVVLRRLGYPVDLFEREPFLGGMVVQVTPENHLPTEAIDKDLARLEQMGIKLHLGSDINAKTFKKIVKKYDAVFLGIGLSNSKSYAVQGSDLRNVLPALDFLMQARDHESGEARAPKVGKSVVVVGGGLLALDAAVKARKLGAERVYVIYQRTLEDMPSWPNEYLEAAALGVEFRWLSSVNYINGHGKVHSVEIQPMRKVDNPQSYQRRVEPDPTGAPYKLNCDTVLVALGQSLDFELVDALTLETTADGTIRVDPRHFQTHRPKVFAAGQATCAETTIVDCLSKGMQAGNAIHHWLSRAK